MKGRRKVGGLEGEYGGWQSLDPKDLERQREGQLNEDWYTNQDLSYLSTKKVKKIKISKSHLEHMKKEYKKSLECPDGRGVDALYKTAEGV